MAFEDIAIVDLDLAKTTWSRVHSAMRTLYLRLSREPEPGWVRFFQEERESRVVIKRHGFWIEDGYIVFDCLLEDVERYHLPDFRQSVEHANRKYRAWLAEQQAQGFMLREDARSERVELAALRERIRFDATVPSATLAPSPLFSGAVSPAAPAANDATALEPERAPPPAPPVAATVAAPEPGLAVDAPVRSNGLAARVAELLRHVGGGELRARLAAAAREPAPTPPDPEASPPAASLPPPPAQAPPSPTAAPAAPLASPLGEGLDADFNAKREEWRARFRAALAAQSKERNRGND